jgi:cytochrome c-type biogenesis protein CcmH/NrfF
MMNWRPLKRLAINQILLIKEGESMSWYCIHKRICKNCSYTYAEDISTVTIVDKEKKCPKCCGETELTSDPKITYNLMDKIQHKLNAQ